MIRHMLFADDDTVVAHSPSHFQYLIDRFAKACPDFALTISLKKQNSQHKTPHRLISLSKTSNQKWQTSSHSQKLQNVTSCLLTKRQKNGKKVGRAASTLARLSKRMWKNSRLSIQVTVFFVLLYGSESWTTNDAQERR